MCDIYSMIYAMESWKCQTDSLLRVLNGAQMGKGQVIKEDSKKNCHGRLKFIKGEIIN